MTTRLDGERAARRAVRRLIVRYTQLQDAADFEGVAALFEHGPFESMAGVRWQGRELAEWRSSNVVLREDGTPGTRHLTSNVQIAVAPDGTTAEARSYFLIQRAKQPGPGVLLVGAGRYLDRFEWIYGATDDATHIDGWRFSHRRAIVDLAQALDEHRRQAAPTGAAKPAIPRAEELPPLAPPGDDREAIEALLYRYAERLNLGDFEGVAALFEGGQFIGADGVAVASKDLESGLRATVRLHDGLPRALHFTTNVGVTLDGDREHQAEARSYWVMLQRTPEVPLQIVACGRYEDTLERSPEGWRFAVRRVLLDATGDMSSALLRPLAPASESGS